MEAALTTLRTDGLADMKLLDAFCGYANASQNRCTVTVQSKAKFIRVCSGLKMRKYQAHDCENLKRIFIGRKYSCSHTGRYTTDVGGPTLLSAATQRTRFRNFSITLRKAEKRTHQVWLCKINSNTRYMLKITSHHSQMIHALVRYQTLKQTV
jgi:hypothetical protein